MTVMMMMFPFLPFFISIHSLSLFSSFSFDRKINALQWESKEIIKVCRFSCHRFSSLLFPSFLFLLPVLCFPLSLCFSYNNNYSSIQETKVSLVSHPLNLFPSVSREDIVCQTESNLSLTHFHSVCLPLTSYLLSLSSFSFPFSPHDAVNTRHLNTVLVP